MTRGATNTAVQGIGRHDRARTQQAGLNDTTLTKTPVQAPIQHRISERYMPLNHARPGQRLGIRPSSMAKDIGRQQVVVEAPRATIALDLVPHPPPRVDILTGMRRWRGRWACWALGWGGDGTGDRLHHRLAANR